MTKLGPVLKKILAPTGGPAAMARRALERLLAVVSPAHRVNKSGNNMSQR